MDLALLDALATPHPRSDQGSARRGRRDLDCIPPKSVPSGQQTRPRTSSEALTLRGLRGWPNQAGSDQWHPRPSQPCAGTILNPSAFWWTRALIYPLIEE